MTSDRSAQCLRDHVTEARLQILLVLTGPLSLLGLDRLSLARHCSPGSALQVKRW